MSINTIVNEVIASSERSTRVLAESTARQVANIRQTPAQIEKLLELAGQLPHARERLIPVLGIMIEALSEHRRALDEVIAEIERLTGTLTS